MCSRCCYWPALSERRLRPRPSGCHIQRRNNMPIKDQLARHFSKTPDVAGALFVAANATVNGDVVLGPQTSVFYGAVLRGDIHEIRVGEGTNIQDNAIVHLADDYGAYIGKWCTIGH